MTRIGIIGGGFTGTMAAVQIINKSNNPCKICLINERDSFNKGKAYNPYSRRQLLNVITSKMSAFPDKPDHFLNWIMEHPEFADHDRALISDSFMPRKYYGDYLSEIWEEAVKTASSKNIELNVIDNFVIDLDLNGNEICIWLGNDKKLFIDKCVIATGNNVPGNPEIINKDFYLSKNYFRNPWEISSVTGVSDGLPVLILGNGLTMVDTVLGLLEHDFKGEIYSISPKGFNILPHRHNGMKYTKLNEQLTDNMNLYDLVHLINKHIKKVREFGASAEPVIDSLRPHTQKIWKRLTDNEKELFMSRLRHLWGVARHRIPLHIHDKIQQLRIDGRLHIQSGRVSNITESEAGIKVEYFDRKEKARRELIVSRVINCTGPETNLLKTEKSFLKSCLLKGIITQDKLNLGIKTDTSTYQVMNPDGTTYPNLFTIGSNLKGELWESTAVNELRTQAERLAESLKVFSKPVSKEDKEIPAV